MGRDSFAFRDLDEELHAFITEERDQYAPHHSPPDAKSKSAKSTRNLNGLSDSTMLKMYVEHHKAQRRRKLWGGVVFIGVALLGVAPMLLNLEAAESDSALELALSAPYRSIRIRGDKDPQYNPLAHENDDENQWIGQEPEVGDVDPHDTRAVHAEPSIAQVMDGGVDDNDGGDAPLDSLETDGARTHGRQMLTRVAATKRLRGIANAFDEEQDDDAED